MELGFSIFSILFVMCFFFSLLLPILIGVFVYKDAKKRNMDAVLWTVIAIFAPGFIGLIIYLIMRSNYPDLQCPSCAQPVTEAYAICPHCGYNLRAQCEQCGNSLEPGWQVCPCCGNQISDAARSTLPKSASKKSPVVLIALIAVVVILGLFVVIGLSISFIMLNKVTYTPQEHYEDFYEEFYEEILPEGMINESQPDLWNKEGWVFSEMPLPNMLYTE